MVEICPLALGVRPTGIYFICPHRLENCPRITAPAGNRLLAAQPCTIGSESYSHPSGAGYPMQPSARRTPGFIGSLAKSSPQRQAQILAAEPNRRGCTALVAQPFALSQQRLGIFSGGNPEFTETAINKSTPPYAANNTLRMCTYEKMGVGVFSPSPRQNSHSAAKHSKISTHAKAAAKYSRMCTYEKNGGGGAPSLIAFPTPCGQEAGALHACAASILKPSRICSYKITGVKQPLESTLRRKIRVGSPAQGRPLL